MSTQGDVDALEITGTYENLVDRPVLGSGAFGIVGSTPTVPTLQQLLPIYGPKAKLRGPYIWKKNNRKIYDVYDGARWKTCQAARLILEIKIGRKLTEEETVDHIDGDPINDSPENLQVLTRAENSSKYHALRHTQQMYTFTCPECKKSATKPMNDVKGNLLKKKAGPFCSRPCAGKYSSRQSKVVRGGSPNPNYRQGL